MKNNVLALVAATIGGLLGHFGFLWIAERGFHGITLPGALVGIAGGLTPLQFGR